MSHNKVLKLARLTKCATNQKPSVKWQATSWYKLNVLLFRLLCREHSILLSCCFVVSGQWAAGQGGRVGFGGQMLCWYYCIRRQTEGLIKQSPARLLLSMIASHVTRFITVPWWNPVWEHNGYFSCFCLFVFCKSLRVYHQLQRTTREVSNNNLLVWVVQPSFNKCFCHSGFIGALPASRTCFVRDPS